MADKKTTRIIARRKKFIEVDVPLIKSKLQIIGASPKDLVNRTIKLDLTRQLKGKSVEATVKINLENDKPVAHPIRIRVLPYFIRRMIRKRISYVEDSFLTPSQESILVVKPFLITRKKVSRGVRKTLRNKTKNWLEDYISQKNDYEIFSDIISNRLQKPLSLILKKTYPLSLCEIRVLEISRPLKPEEIPKIKEEIKKEEIEEIDQFKELEEEKIQKAEKEIEKTQKIASEIEKLENKPKPKKTKKE